MKKNLKGDLNMAAHLAEIIEALEDTNQNCGAVDVATTWGRSQPGYQRLMEHIQRHIQTNFAALRDEAIANARHNYERALEDLRAKMG